jgi:MarR family transcriptional regulator, organic hydroperoxide resistance regulator
MSLPVSDMICFSLYSATHAMQAAYKPLLDQIGLTYPQYLVLTALWQADGQSVGQIGQTLQLESNTLTPLLKRMEAQGLVSRSRSRADERQVMVSLTETGQALQSRAAHIPACILEKSGMTLQALTALRDQINALRGHLRSA